MRSSTYSFPSGKLSRATNPPCFWNCGTAAGEVLNTRHGALPAVIAAPMTSSEDFPAGISWAVISSSGCSSFQAATISSPQAISSGLFDSQILMGPVSLVEPEPPSPSSLPQAATLRASTRLSPKVVVVLMFIRDPFLLWCESSGWVRWCDPR